MSIDPLFKSSIDPLAEPRTIDEARMQMVEALHIAVYGYTGARPESPAQVWGELLDRVTQARQAFERFPRHA